MREDDAGIQPRSDRWRSVQEIKNIVVIFPPLIFFFFFTAVTLHANGRRTTERTVVPPRRNKDQSRLKFPSPTTEPLLLFFLCYSSSSSLGKTTIPDCHTCLCSRIQGTTTSSVKREEEDPRIGMKKKERNTGVVSSVTGRVWGRRGGGGRSTGQTASTPLFSERQKLILIARPL